MQQTSDNECPCECFGNEWSKNASRISSNCTLQCNHKLCRNGDEKTMSEVPLLLSSRWAHATVKIPNLPERETVTSAAEMINKELITLPLARAQ